MKNKLFEDGRILEIGERQPFMTKDGRGGMLRMLVLDVGAPLKNGSILHDMKAFAFFNSKADMLDEFRVDERVRVYFTWKSNEYNGHYYHSVTGWRIEEALHEEQAKYKTSSRPKGFKNKFWRNNPGTTITAHGYKLDSDLLCDRYGNPVYKVTEL